MARQCVPMRGSVAAASVPRPLPAPLTVRPLRPDDGARLGVLMAAAYRGTIDDLGEDDAWHRAEAEATLRGTYGAVLWAASPVAVAGADFAGICLVTDDGPHLLLAFALVTAPWRGKGVGTALIARSAATLLTQGHVEWTLAVTVGNPAQRLYERLGFRPDPSLRKSQNITSWSAEHGVPLRPPGR